MSRPLIKRVFDIQDTTDAERTVESITKGTSLRGFNFWILICSAILASIGLDVNSTAVIIGAMLISPLMSPILGIGLSIGMHDRELFVRALRNLAVATLLSLLASTLYFLLTPFGGITSEIEARTRPTLLDVMVALFGGIAGIISVSRKESNNAIPGVAIATALMPPLCTAGFGIASGKWMYFAGAFYLFFINAVFISLATYLIVKYLKFPVKQYVDASVRKRYARLSFVLLVLVMLPSVYFLYGVYNELQARTKVEKLVIAPISSEGNEILKWEMDRRDSVTNISVYYSGNAITEQRKEQIELLCEQNDMGPCRLQVMRVNMTKEEITGLSEATARRMLEDMELKMAQQRYAEADSQQQKNKALMQVANELTAAFDFVDSAVVGHTIVVLDSATTDSLLSVWYKTRVRTGVEQENRLRSFLKLRTGADTVLLQKW